jgi:hypothetical protein
MWSTGGKRKDREKGKKKESDSDIKSNTLCTSPLASDGVTLSLLYEKRTIFVCYRKVDK